MKWEWLLSKWAVMQTWFGGLSLQKNWRLWLIIGLVMLVGLVWRSWQNTKEETKALPSKVEVKKKRAKIDSILNLQKDVQSEKDNDHRAIDDMPDSSRSRRAKDIIKKRYPKL